MTKVLRYLQGTREYVITYNKGGGVQGLEAYVDSDWGQNIESKRSVTGNLITWNGNLLNWSTRKQACVALSSAEAELISFCSCVCEGLWFQRLLKDLETNCQKMEVFEDNQACIAIINNPGKMKRVKHLDIKLKFITEKVAAGLINITYIPSHLQVADLLTKSLNKVKFKFLVSKIFNKQFSEEEC